MPSKTRGRERLTTCDACGRSMPRDKTITYSRSNVFSTDMKTADDVKSTTFVENHYCISCAKSKRIFEKLKNRAIRAAGREERTQRRMPETWNSGKRW
jgi:ribosomal protein S26